MNHNAQIPESPLHQRHQHESAYRHVAGSARYVDDIDSELIAGILLSPVARACALHIDVQNAKDIPGVAAVLTSADIPGDPMVGPIFHDEPLLAQKEIEYRGQALALVVAKDPVTLRKALAAIELRYQESPTPKP